LAITEEYADTSTEQGKKEFQEAQEARAVVRSANLPLGLTAADRHYCAASATLEGMRITAEQISKRGDKNLRRSLQPGFALCCFVRGGNDGPYIAFSREAAAGIYQNQLIPQPPENELQVALATIESMALPFSKERVELDDEFEQMLQRLSQVRR